MLRVGSNFYTFDELSKRLEEFQQVEQVQLWVRDSRTVVAAAKRARRKSLNPALKYAELTYSCVFGGRRPSDQTKTYNQTSAGGCPFKVRLSTSNDGQALVVKEVCLNHNHEPGKKLHEEPRRLYNRNKNASRTGPRKPVRYIVNNQNTPTVNNGPPCLTLKQGETTLSLRLAQSPFQHMQIHNNNNNNNQQQQQIKVKHQQQQIKVQLEHHLSQQRHQQRNRERELKGVLDSPEHIDTPDHLGSPDLSISSSSSSNGFDTLGSIITNTDQYSYLPPSPISPSSSSLSSGSRTNYSSDDEEEAVEPIVDLDVALEEALGNLDSVSSMDVEDKFSLAPLTSKSVLSSSRFGDCEPSLTALPAPSSPSAPNIVVVGGSDNFCCDPPPAKKLRGRNYKRGGPTAATSGGRVDIPELGLNIADLMDFDVMLF